MDESLRNLAAIELDALTDDELKELVVDLDRQTNRMAAVKVRALAKVEARVAYATEGAKSAAGWLAGECRIPKGAAAGQASIGRSLRSMPVAESSFGDGRISMEHVRLLRNCMLTAPNDFGEHERKLVEHAETMSFRDFRTVCEYWLQVFDPDGSDRTAEEKYEKRHLDLVRGEDGCVHLKGMFDPVDGEAVLNAVRRIEEKLFREDWKEAKERLGVNSPIAVGFLRRTSTQRRADALVELLHRAFAAPKDGKRPLPLVSVLVDYETATGRVCELGSGAVIAPRRVADLFTRSDVERVVFGPAGHVVEVGTRTRFFRNKKRRAVQVQDRRCQWRGCDEPAEFTEIDHPQPYSKGGETCSRTGRCLCKFHHRLVSRGVEPPGQGRPTREEARRLVLQRLASLPRPAFAA